MAPPPGAAAFSLPAWADGPAPGPAGRRLLDADHYDANGCAASCDAGRDYECDRAAPGTTDDFDAANCASSCDTHPATSCDRDCAPSPSPPPRNPWPHRYYLAADGTTLMADGTWPAAPPPSPPPDASGVFWWSLALALALCVCCCACLIVEYGRARPGSNRRDRLFWCCPCLGPWFTAEAARADGWRRCHPDDRPPAAVPPLFFGMSADVLPEPKKEPM